MVSKGSVHDFLSEPVASGASLGGASLGLAVPLYILIPIILLTLGIGIYAAIVVTSVFVSGFVTLFFFALFQWADVDEPWNWIAPLLFGFIAFLPFIIPDMQSYVLGQVVANSQGILPSTGITLPSSFLTMLLLAVFSIICFIIVAFKAVSVMNTWAVLGAGLLSMFLLFAFVSGSTGFNFYGTGTSQVAFEDGTTSFHIEEGRVITGNKRSLDITTNQPVKVKDELDRTEEYNQGSYSYKDFYRRIEEFTFNGRYDEMAGGSGTISVSKTIVITPPTQNITVKTGDEESGWEPLRATMTYKLKGDTSVITISPSSQSISTGNMTMDVYAKTEGDAGSFKGKVTLVFEGSVLRESGESPGDTSGGGTDENNFLGIPIWGWIPLTGLFAGMTVYIGEDKKWF